MSVNAISSFSYSSSIQYQYFGMSISNEQLQTLMEKYGIIQTGDSYTDIRALYQAMYSDAKSTVTQSEAATGNQQQTGSSQSAQEDPNSVPWANLMSQIGLSATGDINKDYASFNDKISAMQSSPALSQQDKATINQLASEASIVFVQQNTSSTSSTQNSQPPSPTGADIQAQLNKMYFLGTEV